MCPRFWIKFCTTYVEIEIKPVIKSCNYKTRVSYGLKLSTYLATKAPVTCPHHKHTIGTWLLKLCSKKFYNTRPIFLWQQLIRRYWPSLIFVWVKSSRRRRRNPLGLGLKSVRKFTPTNSHTHPLSPSLTHRHSQFLPLSLNSPSCKEYKIKRSQLLKDNRSTLTLSPNLTYSLLLSLSLELGSEGKTRKRERKKTRNMFCHTVAVVVAILCLILGGVALKIK